MNVFGQGANPISSPGLGLRVHWWIAIVGAIRRWSSLILQIAVLEFDARFGQSRFGAMLAFAEPLLLVLVLVWARTVFHGSSAPFGTSAVLFYSSGIFPFYVFMRLAGRSQRGGSGRAGRLPGITRTMSLAGTTLSESALILSTMIIWFIGLYVYGLEEAAPFHIGSCLAAVSGLWVLGVGLGLCNAALARYLPFWGFVWMRTRRLLMILSGIFFIADLLPLTFRNIAVWNPLMHGIEWFRWGLYGNYPIMTLDISYFLISAAGLLFIGVIAFWSTIRVTR